MFVRNISKTAVWVAGVTLPPNKVVEIPDNTFSAWLRMGSANRETARTLLRAEAVAYDSDVLDTDSGFAEPLVDLEPPYEPTERESLIEAGIRQMDTGNSDQWNNDGYPNLDVLRDVSGLPDINSAERHSVWDRIRDDIA